MKKLSIPVVLGTGRKERNSKYVAEFVHGQAQDFGFETQLVDVLDHAHPTTIPAWEKNEQFTEWKEVVTRSNGLVLIVPEYNHGYPGELKILLDSAYDEYNFKTVGIVGVSKGGFSGTRVVDHIKPVLIELGLMPISMSLYYGKVEEMFGEGKTVTDEKTIERAQTFMGELQKTTASLAPLQNKS